MRIVHVRYELPLTAAQYNMAHRLLNLGEFNALMHKIQKLTLHPSKPMMNISLDHIGAEDMLIEIKDSILNAINMSLAQNLIEQKDLGMHVPSQKPTPPRYKLKWK